MLLLPAVRALTMRFSGLSPVAVRDYMYSPIHTHSDGLALGVLIAWATVFRPEALNTSKQRIVICVSMLLAAGGLYWLNREVFKYSSLALIFGSAVLAGLGAGTAWRVVNWRGFYVISRLSYGIYLNHFGLVPIVTPPLRFLRGMGAAGYFAAYLTVFAACAALALCSFAAIEWPFLRLREKWAESARRKPAYSREAGSGAEI
jgi:peptidoglycan/LPS O-acetylase OafA/YrhL